MSRTRSNSVPLRNRDIGPLLDVEHFLHAEVGQGDGHRVNRRNRHFRARLREPMHVSRINASNPLAGHVRPVTRSNSDTAILDDDSVSTVSSGAFDTDIDVNTVQMYNARNIALVPNRDDILIWNDAPDENIDLEYLNLQAARHERLNYANNNNFILDNRTDRNEVTNTPNQNVPDNNNIQTQSDQQFDTADVPHCSHNNPFAVQHSQQETAELNESNIIFNGSRREQLLNEAYLNSELSNVSNETLVQYNNLAESSSYTSVNMLNMINFDADIKLSMSVDSEIAMSSIAAANSINKCYAIDQQQQQSDNLPNCSGLSYNGNTAVEGTLQTGKISNSVNQSNDYSLQTQFSSYTSLSEFNVSERSDFQCSESDSSELELSEFEH